MFLKRLSLAVMAVFIIFGGMAFAGDANVGQMASPRESTEGAVPKKPFLLDIKGVEKVDIPTTYGPIVTDTATPIEKGKLAIQPTFGYSFVTDTFNSNWSRGSSGGTIRNFFMNYKLTYGPIEDMEVFLVIPYVHRWARSVDEPGPKGETSADSGGLGDLNLTVKYRLVEETPNLPTVTALFSTGFPTGEFDQLNPSALGTDAIGCGSYLFTTGFNVSKYINPVILYGNLWYSMPTSFTDDDGNQHPGDFVTVNLAAEYPITDKWVSLLELTSSWGGRAFIRPLNHIALAIPRFGHSGD
ncbi:MAG: transporter [Deltaproteobacteria bacterium]|nr:transporter [Deltaproteobacteria bacterium]